MKGAVIASLYIRGSTCEQIHTKIDINDQTLAQLRLEKDEKIAKYTELMVKH